MRSILLCTLAIVVSGAALSAQDTASVPTADGFQCPVGANGSGEGYYIARGYRPNGHLGDDWNGIKGGDTDLGDPVYATAHGIVVFAKNYHVGWGNVVILRHAFYDGSTLRFVDSLYGHLNDFNVRDGQEVKRGQLIGHIGSNSGMYDAHLHFEIRKNINIGMYRGSFPRDDSNYYEPNRFLAAHLSCPSGGRTVAVPINTFAATPPPAYVANKVETPVYSPGSAPASHLPPPGAGSLSLRLSRESPPEPRVVPAATPTPPPKVAIAPPSTPKPQATPAPTTPKAAAIASSSAKTPARSTTATASTTKVTAAPSPTPKTATTASSSTKSGASPTPSTKGTTAATGKKGAATPSPSKPVTTATAKTSTPSPSSKGPATASTSSKPSATPAPVASKEPVPARAPLAEVAAPKTEPKAKPSILEGDALDRASPSPSNGSPIRRSQPTYRVDRFQDLRGMGY